MSVLTVISLKALSALPGVRRVALRTPVARFTLGFYDGEICNVGTCTRPPGHDGGHSQFDGPEPADQPPMHEVGSGEFDLDLVALWRSLTVEQRVALMNEGCNSCGALVLPCYCHSRYDE